MVRWHRRTVGTVQYRRPGRAGHRGRRRPTGRHRLPTDPRCHREVGTARHARHPHPLRHRGARPAVVAGVTASRCHHRDARLVLTVDRARRRHRCRRLVRPGRGHPPRVRDRHCGSPQDLGRRRPVRRGAGDITAGPQPGRLHRSLRYAHRGHGFGPRHPQRATAHSARAGSDGSHAHRGARGGIRGDVLAAATFRQDRRRGLPIADTAVHLRRTARVTPVEVHPASHRSGPAVRPGHSESPEPGVAVGPVVGPVPQSAQNQPAVRGGHQGQSARHQAARSAGTGHQRAGRQLPLATSARPLRGLCRRHRPGGVRGVRRRCCRTTPAR